MGFAISKRRQVTLTGLHGILFEHKAIAEVARSLMLGEQNTDVDYMGV